MRRTDADEVVRSVLESRLRTFEQSLAAKDCTIAQLQAAVSEAQAESCQVGRGLPIIYILALESHSTGSCRTRSTSREVPW